MANCKYSIRSKNLVEKKQQLWAKALNRKTTPKANWNIGLKIGEMMEDNPELPYKNLFKQSHIAKAEKEAGEAKRNILLVSKDQSTTNPSF